MSDWMERLREAELGNAGREGLLFVRAANELPQDAPFAAVVARMNELREGHGG